MKTIKLLHLSILFSICVPTLLLAASQTPSDKNSVYVKVRSTKLKSRPENFSAAVGDLKYGDALHQLSSEGDWFKVVDNSGKQGYIHSSALSARRIVLSSSKNFSASSANQEDVVLAGKGFNANVEKEFASRNAALNFRAVDRMETLKVSDGELRTFAKAGKLVGEG